MCRAVGEPDQRRPFLGRQAQRAARREDGPAAGRRHVSQTGTADRVEEDLERASRLRLVALAEDAGAPLASFVAKRGGVVEPVAREAIARGAAFLRGRRVRDPQATVRAGDRVEIDLRQPERPQLPRVLHLDPLLLAVDKPAGVLAQEGRGGGPALADLCSILLRERGEPDAALLVHRLDRGTTGVTVLARTRAAQSALLEEFCQGRVAKEYLAL